MNKRSTFVEAQWRWTRRFFLFFPFWVLLVVGINVWHDASEGKPFDISHLLIGCGFVVFAAFLFVFSRLIFKFVRAHVRHEEQGP